MYVCMYVLTKIQFEGKTYLNRGSRYTIKNGAQKSKIERKREKSSMS